MSPTVSVDGYAIPEISAMSASPANEAKQRMEEMSESQRQMLEGMLNEQMQKLEEAANSGTMEFTLEVSELRVNEGPPSGP